jgi:hypothetical protein
LEVELAVLDGVEEITNFQQYYMEERELTGRS